jgi:hypothetical protein
MVKTTWPEGDPRDHPKTPRLENLRPEEELEPAFSG